MLYCAGQIKLFAFVNTIIFSIVNKTTMDVSAALLEARERIVCIFHIKIAMVNYSGNSINPQFCRFSHFSIKYLFLYRDLNKGYIDYYMCRPTR